MNKGKDNLGAFDIFIIQATVIFCLPAIMIGVNLYDAYGFKGALTAIIIGCCLICALSLIMVFISVRYKLTSLQISKFYLGKKSYIIARISMVSISFIWFILQQRCIVQAISIYADHYVSSTISIIIKFLIILSPILIIYIVSKGIKYIKNVIYIILPFLIGGFLWLYYLCFKNLGNAEIITGEINLKAIAIVVSSIMALMFNLPNYYRFSGSIKKSYISITIVFILLPFVMGLGIIMGILTDSDIGIRDYLSNGGRAGKEWELSLVFFTIISGILLNCLNLYSAAVYYKVSAKNKQFKKIVMIIGFSAMVIILPDLIVWHHAFPYNVIGSLGGIIKMSNIITSNVVILFIIRFIYDKGVIRQKTESQAEENIIIIIVSGLVGHLGLAGFSLTGAAITDSFFALLILTSIIKQINNGVKAKIINS